ncbi:MULTISPECIES: hypothetical protein [Alphaproteobacteria]|uniref:hypothetical protein n=1 Tax=Sphingopyxis sp. TaxID=1908224 RepID=UPI0040342805
MTHEINIADFAAFCRSKGGGYDYGDPDGCALCEFVLHDTGRAIRVGSDGYRFLDEEGHEYTKFDPRLIGILSDGEIDPSYAALAERLEALIPAPASPWTIPAAYLALAEQSDA